jgi:hypothetical protein
MIRYQLRCAKEHEFEAWFRDSAAFDQQSKARKVLCPDCGSAKVVKAPMAPSIGKRALSEPQAVETPQPPAPAASASSPPVPTPAQIRAYLMAMRKHVETTHEYVGPKFPDEARKIHYGESKERGIYGEATPEDAKELVDEGIDVAAVPWLPREDA